MTEQIFLGQEMPEAGAAEIHSLGLWGNADNEPCMTVETGTEYYIFPLTDGAQIHRCSGFLRSLGLGIDIRFENYAQYAALAEECAALLLNKKQSA